MTVKFQGFEESKKGFTGIPDQFFSELLPAINDLNELKLALYILWSAYKQGDFGAAFTQDSLLADEKLINAFVFEGNAEKSMRKALKQAVKDKILVEGEDVNGNKFYFVNSPRGRQAAGLMSSGNSDVIPEISSASLDMVKPNIFHLYEENIGPLTPMIADMLREAQENYAEEWIREALEIAVQNNVRRWKYIEAILTRWQEEGRDGTNQRSNQEDFLKYFKGKYGDFGEY